MGIECGKIYDDLIKLYISLNFEDTPTPAYIQDRIIECNDHQRRAEQHEVAVRRQLSQKQGVYNAEKFNLESKKRILITSNDRIKKLPTGKEREAAADEMLEKENRMLMELDNEVNELKNLLQAIKTVQSNLKTTNSDIKLLVRIMEQSINRLNIGSREDKDLKDLHGGFSDLEKLESEMNLDDVESSEEIDSEDEEESTETGPVEIDLDAFSDENQISEEKTKNESPEGDKPPEEAHEESTKESENVVKDLSPDEFGDSPGTNSGKANENPASQDDSGDDDGIENFIDSILDEDYSQNESDQDENQEDSVPQHVEPPPDVKQKGPDPNADGDENNIGIDINIQMDSNTDETKKKESPITDKEEEKAPSPIANKEPEKKEVNSTTNVVDVDLEDILSSLE